MEKFKTQIGKSVTCDFHENTWTFEMPKGFCWTGGKFAIVPDDVFEKLQSDKQTLLENLKELVDQLENEHVSDEFCRPLIEKSKEIIKANT